MNIKIVTILSLAVLGCGLSACETVEGFGRDVERAGESIQNL